MIVGSKFEDAPNTRQRRVKHPSLCPVLGRSAAFDTNGVAEEAVSRYSSLGRIIDILASTPFDLLLIDPGKKIGKFFHFLWLEDPVICGTVEADQQT